MFIFVAGVVVGLLVVASRDVIPVVDPSVARTVRSLGSYGYVVVVASMIMGVYYARAEKRGVKGAYALGLQGLALIMSVQAALIPLYGAAPFCTTDVFSKFWPGFFIAMMLTHGLWWRLSPTGRAYRDVEKDPTTRCHHCGYTLVPEQQRCPECGSPRHVQNESEEHDTT